MSLTSEQLSNALSVIRARLANAIDESAALTEQARRNFRRFYASDVALLLEAIEQGVRPQETRTAREKTSPAESPPARATPARRRGRSAAPSKEEAAAAHVIAPVEVPPGITIEEED